MFDIFCETTIRVPGLSSWMVCVLVGLPLLALGLQLGGAMGLLGVGKIRFSRFCRMASFCKCLVFWRIA